MEPDIIYEDRDLIVCHKPAGIATETKSVGQQDMVSLLKNYRAERGEAPYLGVVHRLDQPVEGLLVFAKTQKAAANLSGQVKSRAIGKHYYAMAVGNSKEGGSLVGKSLRLTDYLLADKRANRSTVVPEGTPQAKQAVLDCRVIGQRGERVCFDIRLHTGRHHQIRVQMAHHGWPLLGDTKYGVSRGQETALALCAYRVVFAHPSTGAELDFFIRPGNPVFAEMLL